MKSAFIYLLLLSFMVSPQCTPLHGKKSQDGACEQRHDADSGKRTSVTQIFSTALKFARTVFIPTRLSEHVLVFLAGVFCTASFPVRHDFLISKHQLSCELAASIFSILARLCHTILYAVIHGFGALAHIALQSVIYNWGLITPISKAAIRSTSCPGVTLLSLFTDLYAGFAIVWSCAPIYPAFFAIFGHCYFGAQSLP